MKRIPSLSVVAFLKRDLGRFSINTATLSQLARNNPMEKAHPLPLAIVYNLCCVVFPFLACNKVHHPATNWWSLPFSYSLFYACNESCPPMNNCCLGSTMGSFCIPSPVSSLYYVYGGFDPPLLFIIYTVGLISIGQTVVRGWTPVRFSTAWGILGGYDYLVLQWHHVIWWGDSGRPSQTAPIGRMSFDTWGVFMTSISVER